MFYGCTYIGSGIKEQGRLSFISKRARCGKRYMSFNDFVMANTDSLNTFSKYIYSNYHLRTH